jgi:peptide deformylase
MTDETIVLNTIEAYQPKLLSILKWPDDERLHQKSIDVLEFNQTTYELAHNLLHTMKVANGVGLAAPQTGNLVNVIVVGIGEDEPLVFVNPVIIFASEELFEFNEGCLSVPGYFEDRKRPNQVIVKCLDLNGDPHEYEFNGLYAFVIQHEIDHLNGKVFVDGASMLKRSRIKSKMKKVTKRLGK